MKNTFSKIIMVVSFVFSLNGTAQSEKDAVKETIITFFEAFHKQDTVALKRMAKGNITMQSISLDENNTSMLSEMKFYDFTKSIASIPKDRTFEEKLLGFDIKVDGSMASVWTPYEFWYNGKFSHCGVNSFQLIKENETWKIIYLVDTRRVEQCSKKS
ncbi:nuclear transport factor 2 family protein [Winogradskyella aurantia]|uniref:3-methyl-2-oxobutanoate hydroxymethyltransferase n=1 Tax=Winogradskyella aurantia TaxID=1915063 RepID=A0A265UXU2_9FLAO|nr:nuclear transport factor 2 family protein [Winogradskyella aurantia]OZV70148.1 3-methyl-2-oxobutanoate hydroxymethyltransferase [Winogradskyella aurantia]